jgi:hypothetical protein
MDLQYYRLERASRNPQVIQTALANPLDKFELGIRKLIEDFMIERMAENDRIVTRYMSEPDFQGSAFPILAKEIFNAVRDAAPGNHGQAASSQREACLLNRAHVARPEYARIPYSRALRGGRPERPPRPLFHADDRHFCP